MRITAERTHPLERVNSEIRRANLVGIFPNREALIRPVGRSMPEQDDARAVPAASVPVEKPPALRNDPDPAAMNAR